MHSLHLHHLPCADVPYPNSHVIRARRHSLVGQLDPRPHNTRVALQLLHTRRSMNFRMPRIRAPWSVNHPAQFRRLVSALCTMHHSSALASPAFKHTHSMHNTHGTHCQSARHLHLALRILHHASCSGHLGIMHLRHAPRLHCLSCPDIPYAKSLVTRARQYTPIHQLDR